MFYNSFGSIWLGEKGPESVGPQGVEMLLEESLNLFLLSRKRGTCGARKPAREKTLFEYRYDLSKFLGFMNERGILVYEAIKKSDILAFIDTLDAKVKSAQWADASRSKVLRSLRAFFRWVELDDDCREEHLKNWAKALPAIQKTPNKKFVPERGSLKRFMSAPKITGRTGMRDYVLMSLLLDTGMRIGELALLRIDHLKIEDRRLIVPEKGKTGTRLVTISTEMARLLQMWLKKRNSWATTDYVFCTRSGKQPSSETFRKMFAKRRARMGIKGITPHTLRHCFCTYFLEGGGDIAKLQALTGHSSLDMLKGYLNLSGQSLAEEQERVSPLRQVKTAKGAA